MYSGRTFFSDGIRGGWIGAVPVLLQCFRYPCIRCVLVYPLPEYCPYQDDFFAGGFVWFGVTLLVNLFKRFLLPLRDV